MEILSRSAQHRKRIAFPQWHTILLIAP